MRKIALFIFVIVFSSSLFAQSFEEEYIVNSGDENMTEVEQDELVTEYSALERLNYNFNLGTAFTAWNGGSMLSTYVNPNINYKFTPKFSISTGVVVSNNTLLSNYYNLSGDNTKSNFVDTYVHFTGIYQVSEKLQVNGSVMYHTNSFTNEMNANAFDNLDYSIGAKYKLTKNIEVGVQLTKRSYNPYMPFDNFRSSSDDNF